MSKHLQAILFNKHVWEKKDAIEWMIQNDLKPIKPVHVTENYLRFRMSEPELYDRFTSEHRGEYITLVFGWK